MSEENEGIIATLTRTIEQNWRLLLVGVIIIAIALNSSWSGNKSSSGNKDATAKQSQQAESSQQPNQNKPQETTQTADNNTNNTAQAKEPETATASVNANTSVIAETAVRSEGVTHLARRAIKEYLGSTQENLSAEQKIYAEDYVSKKTGAKILEVGEKLEFSTDVIKQSIEQAKGLNQKQIENLSKYVPLVKNLN